MNPGSGGEVRDVSEEHPLQSIEVKVLTFGEFGYILEISPGYKCIVTLGNPHDENVTVKYCRLRNHMLSTRRKLKIREICTIGGPWTALPRLKLPYTASGSLVIGAVRST